MQFVENMLNVHSKYSEMIKEVFNSDQSFVGALDKACSAIVNHRHAAKQPVRAPELVNSEANSLLKKIKRTLEFVRKKCQTLKRCTFVKNWLTEIKKKGN